ncbi:DUF547 domain-containing protein [Vibrio sp. SCSIO 43132]|uniref:DUF547 domain-containing protein n=1 Tax=Vibrio sp. SCSIO 43132 TaxID=2779363 RepID=UPI001CA8CE11|nr:DUF547 domain-containing protein [Vibrio sp. SCSIO 43132]UAB69831.1 DUF547 domain-containing protein [Vibrio sp. SCSIO 43132]
MRILLTVFIFLFSSLSFAAPKSDLWEFWQKNNESNTATISHQAWDELLKKYLAESGQHNLFDYAGVTTSDKAALKSYIQNLASQDPRSYSLKEQYAYWVNMYNAITVDLILDDYPVKSITKLGGLFSFGPWGEKVVKVVGKDLTLNDIEHRILRPIWNDPRTHYAVNCASLGCPNLQTTAFTADNTEALLEQAAQSFVNSDKGVSLNSDGAQLSSIYEWFVADFGGNEEGVITHLKQYRSDLPLNRSSKIKYDYDWDLNKQ